MSLTSSIKNEAARLGFILAGITRPQPPVHWPIFESWLAQGRHGSMKYLSDPRRADPRLVLPECRSIIVLALPYPNPNIANSLLSPSVKIQAQERGNVAAYAWGRDYHFVISERLKLLITFIETQYGSPVKYRSYTDTGPLLERDLAQEAGLGWIGKNTCLINPRIGSYFLLAEILLSIELDLDDRFTADRCGTCSRCITACPTSCILPDRTIDARNCISYLTIENKDVIPSNLRSKIGNKIFGCDICQTVCPWNKFARKDHDPAFSAKPGIPYPVLVDELALTPQEFNRKFKESPILRSKWRGYLRNICVALGNTNNPESIPALERVIQENNPLVMEHAVWALEQIHKNIPNLE